MVESVAETMNRGGLSMPLGPRHHRGRLGSCLQTAFTSERKSENR